MNRRKFLFTLSLGLGLIAIYLPKLFNTRKNNFDVTFNGKRLIIIHLDGGNDGLFTIAPRENDIINAQRKSLIKELSNGIKLDGDLLLNKHLGDFADLLSKGWLSIIPNVGYPEPNTSHFVSSEIWATGSLPSEGLIRKGWFGNLIEKNRLEVGMLDRTAISFESGRHLIFQGETNHGVSYSKNNISSTLERELHELVYENVEYFKGYQEIKRELKMHLNLSSLFADIEPSNGYPNTAFGKKLATISSMITKQKPFKVFHIKHGGYDTHLGQNYRLNNLYHDLSSCLKTFAFDLNKMGEWMNTQVLIFSEFGRSIDENTNGGTDHGTAGPVFVLGGEQIYGNLADIQPFYKTYKIADKPYLKHQIDFRDIFTRVINNWLT
jgi:uncharacterized protein (DUF1501 family)